MSFAMHGFQSRQQYSNNGIKIYFKSLGMREFFRDWNTINTHPLLYLAFSTIFLIQRLKVSVLLIVMSIGR